MRLQLFLALSCISMMTLSSCSVNKNQDSEIEVSPIQPKVKIDLAKIDNNFFNANVELLAAPVKQDLLFQFSEKICGEEGLAAAKFLWEYMPVVDKQQLTTKYLLTNIVYAIKAREVFSWGKEVPIEIFLNDVVPYANTTERRDDWRGNFYERFGKMVLDCENSREAVLKIMSNIQKEVGVEYNTRRRRADQGPMESIELKMASCSGLSILAIDACRAVGIPARLAGIISWSHIRGNHNWLEVWIDGKWHMTEYNTNSFDEGWVIDNCGLADTKNPLHRIYASSWKPSPEDPNLKFPIVWGMGLFINDKIETNFQEMARYNSSVSVVPFKDDEGKTKYFVMNYTKNSSIFPGINVSARYKELAKIQAEKKKQELAKLSAHQLYLGFVNNGIQEEKEIVISCEGKEIVKGRTNGKDHDLNDLMIFNVPEEKEIIVEYTHLGVKQTQVIKTTKNKSTTIKINL